MVPPKAIILFVGATLLGLVAVIVARTFLVQPPVRAVVAAAGPAMPNAVVATMVIPAGAPIVAAQLKPVAIPAAALPAGAFSSIAEIVGHNGRTAVRQIEANELVSIKAVSGSGTRLSTSGAIAPQMRAVAVRVSDVAGVGGLLSPGDRVDVMVTRTIPGTLGGPPPTEVQTDLIVQNARVLAVDQDIGPVKLEADKAKIPATVTVEVGVEQAQKLALAQTVGTISLMLRASNDLGAAVSRTIRLADLGTGGARPAGPRLASSARRRSASRVPAGSEIEVVRGMATKNYTLSVLR